MGADPNQFASFTLDGLRDYTILDNRRSSNEIIDLLNVIRTEFQQHPIRNEHGMKPLLLVGELLACYEEAKRIAANEVHALSYRNIEANILKQRVDAHVQNSNLLNQIEDSNANRKEFVTIWIKAIEHARNKQFGATFKMLENIGVKDIVAYTSVKEALGDYEKYCNGTLKDFFDYLCKRWQITKIKKILVFIVFTLLIHTENYLNVLDYWKIQVPKEQYIKQRGTNLKMYLSFSQKKKR